MSATAASFGLVSCHTCQLACQLVSRAQAEEGLCPRCGSRVHFRKAGSIGHCWAFLIAAMILYIPANTLPMMLTSSLFGSSDDTIISGVLFLWEDGSWYLALVVFVASILVPMLKLSVLALLAWSTQSRSTWRPLERTKLYRIVERIGRWSMLDVFVDGVMAAAAQLPPFLVIEPGPGLLFFMAVVVLTVLAARSFDTRLIWDAGVAHG